MYNIAIWAVADRETTLFLLPFQEIGASAKEKFVSKCIKDPANFKKPIKKQKVVIFATQLKKYKIKGDEKGEIAMIRGLFVSILVLSLQQQKSWHGRSSKVSFNSIAIITLSYWWSYAEYSKVCFAKWDRGKSRVCITRVYWCYYSRRYIFLYIYSLIYWAQWVKQLQ